MEFSLTPGYKDIFNIECSDPQSLIDNYNSEGIIYFLSFLNAQCYLNDDESQEFQTNLITKLVEYWPVEIKEKFHQIINTHLSKHGANINLFKNIYITYFISHELKSFKRDGKAIDAEGEFQVVLAYLAYIDKFNSDFSNIISTSNFDIKQEFFFQKVHWPFLVKQFDFNEKVDPAFQAICSGLLLDFLFLSPKYNQNAIEYLKHYNRNSVWQFVFDFIELIKLSFNKNEEHDVHYFAILPSPDFNSILDNYSVNIDDYISNQNSHLDYLGIKQKPLYKSSQGHYIVLNWKYFCNSLYYGVMFDFKNKFNLSYNTFKSSIGYEVIEKKLFRPLFKYMFDRPGSCVQFSDDSNMPDCYLRIGKYIFLFEVKDYLMSTEIVTSGSFETISNHFNKNFIVNSDGKKKGIKQLLEQILYLENNCYSFDDFIQKGIKRRNIVIVPIIVTTSFIYQMPGINSYLSKIMSESLANSNFNTIMPLTMIDFKYFYRNFVRIRSKEINLFEMIDRYHKRVKKVKKESANSIDYRKQLIINSAFEETFVGDFKKQQPPQKEKEFTRALFEALTIKPEDTTIK